MMVLLGVLVFDQLLSFLNLQHSIVLVYCTMGVRRISHQFGYMHM
jgi:hypothetical protein